VEYLVIFLLLRYSFGFFDISLLGPFISTNQHSPDSAAKLFRLYLHGNKPAPVYFLLSYSTTHPVQPHLTPPRYGYSAWPNVASLAPAVNGRGGRIAGPVARFAPEGEDRLAGRHGRADRGSNRNDARAMLHATGDLRN